MTKRRGTERSGRSSSGSGAEGIDDLGYVEIMRMAKQMIAATSR